MRKRIPRNGGPDEIPDLIKVELELVIKLQSFLDPLVVVQVQRDLLLVQVVLEGGKAVTLEELLEARVLLQEILGASQMSIEFSDTTKKMRKALLVGTGLCVGL